MKLKRNGFIILSGLIIVFGGLWGMNCKNNEMANQSLGKYKEIIQDHGEHVSKLSSRPKGEVAECFLNTEVGEEEKAEVVEKAKALALSYKTIYSEADKGHATNVIVDEETIKAIVQCIGEQGYAVVGCQDDLNMNLINGEQVDTFLNKAQKHQEGAVSIYEVNWNGGFTRLDFETMSGKMTVVVTCIDWDEEMNPNLSYFSKDKIMEWDYTPKGYFIYKKYHVADNGGLYSHMIRIKPLSEACIKMNRDYIGGIGYQGNNLLLTDWNEESLNDLDFNDLYEYLYMISFGKKIDSKEIIEGIPEAAFEELVMKYFKIDQEALRKNAYYNAQKGVYTWYPLCCANYTPSAKGVPRPEVVEIKENRDGTKTLFVDAVWEELGCDCAFKNEVTIRELGNGQIQFVGNKIQKNKAFEVPRYDSRNQCAQLG